MTSSVAIAEEGHDEHAVEEGSGSDSLTKLGAFVAAAVSIAVSVLGASIAVAKIGSAAMGVLAEKPELAMKALRKLPRDSSATRIRNRCAVTGRPRAFYRKFGISRIALRELAHRGELPGVTKASW